MRHHPHLSTVRLPIETLPTALRQTFWQKQRDPHQSNGIQTRVCISKNARKLGSTARLREKEQRRKRRDKRGETRETREKRNKREERQETRETQERQERREQRAEREKRERTAQATLNVLCSHDTSMIHPRTLRLPRWFPLPSCGRAMHKTGRVLHCPARGIVACTPVRPVISPL